MTRINLNGKIHTANSYMRSECIENGLVASASSTQIRMFRLCENDNRWLHFVFEANHCIYLLFIWHKYQAHIHTNTHTHSNQCHRNDSFVLEIMQNCHLIIIACAIHLARCKMFNSSVKSFRFVSLQFTAFGSIGLIAGKRCQNRYDLRMSAHA